MPLFDEFRAAPLPAYTDLDALPDDRNGIFRIVRDAYTREDEVRKIAHWMWERDGKPDGDRMSNRIQLSVKDAHWLSATLMLELTADMDADTLWAMKVAYVS